jgi:ABC-type polysaccharide/polyol phosphate export permease
LALFFIVLALRQYIKGGGSSSYPIYLLIGLLIFNFFRKTTQESIKIMDNNSKFIKSIKVNKFTLVISLLFSSFLSHMFEVILLVGVIVFLGLPLVGIVYYMLFFIFIFLFVLGISFILSTIGAYINDLGNVWDMFTRMLMFLTPIFYIMTPGSGIYYINSFNPLYYYIDISRQLVIEGNVTGISTLFIAVVFSILFLVTGIWLFDRNKDRFAELV